MADNVTLPATGVGASTPVIATRKINGVDFQRVLMSGDDGGSTDSFGRWRSSQIQPQFTSMSEYVDSQYQWESALVGTGVYSVVTNQNSIRLSTGGTGNGASAIRQSRRYMRYTPGVSLLVLQTFAMSAPQANGYAEIGYYDASNGYFLQRAGTTVQFIERSFVTGVVVDTPATQANWNIDNMLGGGGTANPSGLTLDLTKTQILVIDLQYLGVGRVRVGFVINGALQYVHQFLHANLISTVYMSTGCLPVRARVWNNGVAAGTVTMDMICTSVSDEGTNAFNIDEGVSLVQFSISNGITTKATATTLRPLISIRAATKLGGTGGTIANHGWVVPKSISLMTTTADNLEYQLLLNPATFTADAWVAYGSNSLVEYDISATALTGGTNRKSGYVYSGTRLVEIEFPSLPLVYGALAGVQDTFTVAVRTLTATGTAVAAITWQEYYL